MLPQNAAQVPTRELSKQQILQLLQKLKEMRANGITNTNQQYQSIVNLLKSQKNFQQLASNAYRPAAKTPSPGITSVQDVSGEKPQPITSQPAPMPMNPNSTQQSHTMENYTNWSW
uniref:Uncharacterized protein n=1 Tax=Vannella robusta TaxID=1487602 RepID=A0A7S4MM07_9EUKA|mmetsp:Transcript_2941/g.3628  ORF Transcript_2941/g.3628 Transcript_2941/m.3628 type:complete len:116 (+) Transcript_2941:294-641(+)